MSRPLITDATWRALPYEDGSGFRVNVELRHGSTVCLEGDVFYDSPEECEAAARALEDAARELHACQKAEDDDS